jgi:hypothetical protein
MKSSRPPKQQTTIIIPQEWWPLIRTCLWPLWRASCFLELDFALLVPPYLPSSLVYLILRALSPIKVYDRKINISSLFHFIASEQFEKALNCRASCERKDKPFPYNHSATPTTLRTAVCIYDSPVTPDHNSWPPRDRHTLLRAERHVPDADITAASPLWNDLGLHRCSL